MRVDRWYRFTLAFFMGWIWGTFLMQNMHYQPVVQLNIEPHTLQDTKPNQPQKRSQNTITKHGQRCTQEQAANIAAQEPIMNSNCPDKSTWMPEYVKSSRNNPDAVLMWIGCNRGDDLAEAMRVWSRNTSYQTDLMQPYYVEFYGQRSCMIDTSARIENLTVRPVRVFCVEAMTSTFEVVNRIYSELAWNSAVEVIHAAVSSIPGISSFPRHSPGFEAFGLESKSDSSDLVQVITVDSLVAKYGLTSIDVLSIDTEGNDMRVIFGAVHTLPKVKYLEFEYHNVNRWGQSDLQDLIDLLDQFDFDCFWTGNNGQLWRLTGCWHDSYYSKRFWSNVACSKRNEQALHQAMVKHSFLSF